MNVSVIVPTLNRPADLKKFIRSLEKQTFPPSELIIADQSDNDRIHDCIVGYQKTCDAFRVKYLWNEDKSLTRAKNLAVDHVDRQADLVAFFDDDIELFEDFLQVMVSFFKKDPEKKYAVATGLISPDGSNETGFRRLLAAVDSLLCRVFILGSPGSGKFKINGSPSFYRSTAGPASDVEVISGGVSVFRKEILDTFRFDGNMKTYCYMEDVDIGYRISRKHQNALVPEAKVYHRHSPESRSDKAATRSQFIQNYCYLFRKNIPGNVLTRTAFIWSVAGLFVIALCELQFRSLWGYAEGLGRVVSNQYDSLYPGWQKNLVQYQ